MSNNITELVFILDRSGSMQGLEKDTIGGFNSLIEKQKALSGTCYVSTVLFDGAIEVLHDRLPLDSVPAMTEQDYTVRGSTSLLDAVGGAIRHIGNIHKYARSEDIPARTLFVITTDGMENTSRRFTANEVKELIEHQKSKYGWEFLFLGANIDAVSTARSIGISADRAANYHADSKGTEMVFGAVSHTIGVLRSEQPLINADWSKRIDEDFENRKK